MKFGAAIPLLNEFKYIPAVTGQMLKACDRVVILRSRLTMAGQPAILLPMPDLDPRVEIIEDTWPTEQATRNAGMEMLQDCDYIFTVDSDEIFSDDALVFLKNACLKRKPRAIMGGFWTYWKTCEYRIDPPEKLIASIVVRKDVRFSKFRMFEGEGTAVPMALFHHLSYVRTDDEVKEKITTFAHAPEVIPGWYENVWLKWNADKTMENLHPTHPTAYKRAVPITDGKLASILAEYGIK